MPEHRTLLGLERALNNGQLWPPIADSIKTFVKRRESGDFYEQIWRLIHIWEAVSTTLCNVTVAKIASSTSTLDENGTKDFDKICELLHGAAWDEDLKQVRPIGLGALGGSNEKRIEILMTALKSHSLNFRIVKAISKFCGSSVAHPRPKKDETNLGESLRQFQSVWFRVCDGSLNRANDKELTVIDCLSAVNQFRNRFAHVPFPPDCLKDLLLSLEELTELLFSVQPCPGVHLGGSALTGCVLHENWKWIGDRDERSSAEYYKELQFGFPAHTPQEIWPASPFAFVDENKRAYLMTRLANSDSSTFEFTRFYNEGNSVISREVQGGLARVPAPGEPDCDNKELNDTFGQAVAAMKQRRFEVAIPLIEQRLKDDPNYHVGWQQLGFAQREYSRQITDQDSRSLKSIQLLKDSIDALGHAAEHKDESRRALAFYHRSKSCLRLYQLTADGEWLVRAKTDAQQAEELDPREEYRSWVKHLQERFCGPIDN